jgi:arylformamidase
VPGHPGRGGSVDARRRRLDGAQRPQLRRRPAADHAVQAFRGCPPGAAALATDWSLRDLPLTCCRAVLISGIYDPAPAILTTVNAELKLTPAIARRQNYEQATPFVRCPVEIMAGGEEPSHWIDQSFRYAHHLAANGMGPGVRVSPGFHHFDIMNQYQDPDSDVLRAILRMARR